MNERIEALMDQCEEEYSTQHYPCWDMEKFAELIVQECAGIVNSLEQYQGPGDCSTAEYIKEHFGVEE